MKGNSRIIGELQSLSFSSANGEHDLFDQFIANKDTNWPIGIRIINFQPNIVNINETTSNTVSITLQTTGFANGTTLYWTVNQVSGTVTSEDFDSGYTGSFQISGDEYASTDGFSITVSSDFTPDGTDVFNVQLRLGSTSGEILNTTQNITISDTSTEVPEISVVFTGAYSSGVLAGGTSQNVSSKSVSMSIASNTAGVPRYIIAACGFRDASGAITGYTPIVTAVSINGIPLLRIANGASDYNSSDIYAGYADVGGTVTVNMNFYRTEAGSGYVNLFVYDGVTSVSNTTDYIDSDASASSRSVNVPANTDQGATFRIVAMNTSNSSTPPDFTSSDGLTYTLQYSHDNGTTEWSSGRYYQSPTSINTALTGTVSSGVAPNGIAFAAAIFKLQ